MLDSACILVLGEVSPRCCISRSLFLSAIIITNTNTRREKILSRRIHLKDSEDSEDMYDCFIIFRLNTQSKILSKSLKDFSPSRFELLMKVFHHFMTSFSSTITLRQDRSFLYSNHTNLEFTAIWIIWRDVLVKSL